MVKQFEEQDVIIKPAAKPRKPRKSDYLRKQQSLEKRIAAKKRKINELNQELNVLMLEQGHIHYQISKIDEEQKLKAMKKKLG